MLDGDRVRAKAPTYTVFNGRYNGMVDKPLPAKPGERVRLFVLNVGPVATRRASTSSARSSTACGSTATPTTRSAACRPCCSARRNGAIVEFVIPEAGSYIMVDHHFANASQGAIGLIARGRQARGRRGEPRAPQHSRPPRRPPIRPRCRASSSFETKCLACHSIGGGDKLGPDLYGVTKRRDDDVARALAEDPGADAASPTPIAKAMLDKYKMPMPNQNLSDAEIREYIEYFKWADANLRPQGKDAAAAGGAGCRAPAEQDAVRFAGCRVSA